MVSFRSYPWEQKGFVYFIKDTIRNRPQMILCTGIYIFAFPPMAYYLWSKEESKSLFYSRFRPKYIVYREDDPRIKNIIRLDEKGNRIFLEPKTN